MKRATSRTIRKLQQFEPSEREHVAGAPLALTVPRPKFNLTGTRYVAAIQRRVAAVEKPGYRGIAATRALAKARAAVVRGRRK